MRTVLNLLIFTLVTLQSFAQAATISSNKTLNDSTSKLNEGSLTHFTFKDIPINGSLNQFVTRLIKQNFKLIETSDHDALLTGRFAEKEVNILVQASSKTVYSVTVMYPKQTSWKAIKTQYENIKEILTAKYGKAKEIIEKFDDPKYEKYSLELLALSQDKCDYMAHFITNTGNGMIRLNISNDANLVINYVDAINYLLVSNESYKEY